MSTFAEAMRRVIRRRDGSIERVVEPGIEVPAEAAEAVGAAPAVEIAPNDPLLTYLQTAGGAVELERLELESPAVEALRAAGVALVVPLVSGGELIGTLNLGPRLSDQQYSSDDKRLLDSLAAQAAPALQVAELVRRQASEAASRERIEQELRVAQLIQQNFLPRELPQPEGWTVDAYYKPAREVGGDFYDFFELADGQIGVVVGDVTDKGVPAAMVMAAARSVLRATAGRIVEPGVTLHRVNNLLVPDIPEKMFVTCLYGVLDPETGRFRFANAGHNLPFARTGEGPVELRATGMPLGLMSDMSYDEKEAWIAPGDSLLLYSDGVTEAHSPGREMFGTPRLQELVAGGDDLISGLLADLAGFTGEGWEQEDDITLVTIRRSGTAAPLQVSFTLASSPGNDREAMERVAAAVEPLGLEPRRLHGLKTAVSEAALNAIEHGNAGREELPVEVEVACSDGRLVVRISDHGLGEGAGEPEIPDLEAKLAGLQKPRGWGLFLIKAMVDDLRVEDADGRHTVELVLNDVKGGGGGGDH